MLRREFAAPEEMFSFRKEIVARLREQSEAEFFGEEESPLIQTLRIAWEEDLTALQRRYLSSCFLDGLSVRKTAARYGVSSATVSRTVRRGAARLRKALRPFFQNRHD